MAVVNASYVTFCRDWTMGFSVKSVDSDAETYGLYVGLNLRIFF